LSLRHGGDGFPYRYRSATLAAEDRKTFHPGAVVIDAMKTPFSGRATSAQKGHRGDGPQGGRYSY